MTREIVRPPRGQHAPNLGATIPGPLKWGTVTSLTSKKTESLSVLHILVGGIPIPKNSYKWLVISYHDISYLVGGIPTPLKNDDELSVGMIVLIIFNYPQYDGKVIIQPCSSHHQPENLGKYGNLWESMGIYGNIYA